MTIRGVVKATFCVICEICGLLMIIVISGTSGSGKTSVVNELLAKRDDLSIAVSATTRSPREGEADGREYFFVPREEFEAKREAGEFAEWAKVHGNFYGTLKAELARIEGAGKNVLLDIDVQGAASIRALYPDCLDIFIEPPSIEELEKRLRKRGSEDEESLARRLAAAQREIDEAESGKFKHIVVNEELERTVKEVEGIIDSALG